MEEKREPVYYGVDWAIGPSQVTVTLVRVNDDGTLTVLDTRGPGEAPR